LQTVNKYIVLYFVLLQASRFIGTIFYSINFQREFEGFVALCFSSRFLFQSTHPDFDGAGTF